MSTAHYILDVTGRSLLAEYASSNVLVALDYDGTLAPIVARPQEARMRPRTKALLHALARRYPTVAISGRALADVSARLKSVALWHVFGNHGIEGTPQPPPIAAAVRQWVQILQRTLAPELGIEIEDKIHSVTLHTRRARDRRRALAAIDEALHAIQDVTVIGGKEVVNLLPSGAGNKGIALNYAMQAFACTHAIYVGDDETDEDAFGVARSAPVLAVRVGHSDSTAARYYLNSQEEVDVLLESLVNLRHRPVPSPAGA